MCKSCTNFVCVCEKVARWYSIGVLHHWSLKRYVDPPKIMPHWWCLLSRLSCLRFHIFWNPQNLSTLNPLKGAFIVKLNKSTNTHSRIKNTSRDQTSSDFNWVSQSIGQIAKQRFSIHETGEKYFPRNLNIWSHEKLAQFDRCVASSFHTSQIIYRATAAKLCRSQMFYSLEAHTHKLTLVLKYVPATKWERQNAELLMLNVKKLFFSFSHRDSFDYNCLQFFSQRKRKYLDWRTEKLEQRQFPMTFWFGDILFP